LAVFPGRVETPGVQVTTAETGEERIIRYETSAGILTARWTLGPDSDWWQKEYPVKSKDDLAGVLELAAARTYSVDARVLEGWEAEVGSDGILAIELPRRPYSDLLHDFLGWSEGLLFLREPIIGEIIDTLEAKLQRFVRDVAQLPGQLVLSPDNLDGQFISPKACEQYLSTSYRRTTEALHAHGKRLIVHIGGPIRRLLGPLAQAGVDGFEGVAGAPQSDLSLTQARELVGPRPVLWGGIAQDYLLRTREQVEFRAAVAEAVREAQGDKRIILGVADRVPVQADLTRLRALPELIRQARAR
jgi:hypothetical protein